MPETILGVGLLVLIKAIDQPRTYLVLLLGHVLLALPFVVLVIQARLIGIRRVYEEAALSLGAPRAATFREVTLPLLLPAVFASVLLAFTISFDNTTASLFWRPAGRRDHADTDPVDAEDLHQPGGQCAGHADDRRLPSVCRCSADSPPKSYPGFTTTSTRNGRMT